MQKERLTAFSDGVLAIIITIMVLELKVPHGAAFADLLKLAPTFLSYVLSFIYIGIYWNNHHHMLYATERVNGAVLWANMHLLFWLSLLPVASGWIGENHFAPVPVAGYGFILFMLAVSYLLLVRTLTATHGKDSDFARRLGSDWKGKLPLVAYALAILLAFINPWISMSIYTAIGVLWFIPDKRFEK